MEIWRGRPYPLGATFDGEGVNFALFSDRAERVELCLFDSPNAPKESVRVEMPEYTDHVWHVYLPGLLPGQLYGYRVYGAYDPDHGLRFNPYKVLLDPYAREIGRNVYWDPAVFDFEPRSRESALVMSRRDNAAVCPLAAVVDCSFDWSGDHRPNTPWEETIIYEAHLRGLTAQMPEVPERLRGTFLGACSQPVLRHLCDLGVTAVEFLPVHFHLDEEGLVRRGKANYWGYNTLAFFAPDLRYSSAAHHRHSAIREFKTMVKAYHSAGIEVILDVVYNHSAEGGPFGPTLSFRGIDNLAYYRTDEQDPRKYVDFTGCGNTLNVRHPRVLQLTMDSLRYWVEEMHVDGFRFDLASALARELHDVDKLGSFFDVIHQDPVISQVKLIAEPWDAAWGGYQVGNFPVLWSEWNDQYRDTVRRFWRGDSGFLGTFATRLCGSSDIYQKSGRGTAASLNFVTCHDGFTLEDLVSYSRKHNEENGEENRDGIGENFSSNGGEEGPSQDSRVLALRDKQKRNFVATLMLSLGVPMLLAGDELSKSQDGNNNAYCHDNPLNWLPWRLDDRQRRFLAFVQKAIAIRRREPALRRRRFFSGRDNPETGRRDISWVNLQGFEMQRTDWEDKETICFGALIDGHEIGDIDERGRKVEGSTLLILVNADARHKTFRLPEYPGGDSWEKILSTDSVYFESDGQVFSAQASFEVEGRSLSLFRLIQNSRERRFGHRA